MGFSEAHDTFAPGLLRAYRPFSATLCAGLWWWCGGTACLSRQPIRFSGQPTTGGDCCHRVGIEGVLVCEGDVIIELLLALPPLVGPFGKSFLPGMDC